MQGSDVRRSFLGFFESKGHLIVPSASIVPAGDPTLMFTNAGMVPFKDVFLGLSKPPQSRVADSQKCLRISGKHNDLEEVGRDTYHHTLFEMLGNWSFGDYYKPEAIEWAWQLLTDEWDLPQDKLYASVYRTDDEAAELWRKITPLPDDRIMRFDEKDNFWEMGETGPCGPCSEIHIDRGPAACDMPGAPGHVCQVNGDCARYIELWNLVFIQYSRDDKGELHELPAKHIDTGMGLERVAAVLENVDGNYDGSLLRELIRVAEKLSGREYGSDPEMDVSFRVLADHGRAVSFMLSDGIAASNEGRGYVLRRLLRRAARHARQIGLEEPSLWQVCRGVIDNMSDAYPELTTSADDIIQAVRDEEERFAVTLERGLQHLDDAVTEHTGKTTVFPGNIAFRLYDTYGFPVDMTEDILRGRGWSLDQDGFDAAMEEQRARARGAQAAKAGATDYTLLVAAARKQSAGQFAGAREAETEDSIVAMSRGGELIEHAVEGDLVELVTGVTPFYGESGGQVGDTGTIATAEGEGRVVDTRKPALDCIVHHVQVQRGRLAVGDAARLTIDSDRREAVRLNHSATHLMHAALRHHLGEDVHQQGSYVDDARLRFDFNHKGGVSDEKLADIETEVNAAIRSNLPVSTEEMPYDDAVAAGALAFFGDKYGDLVRVVKMGDYSVELCGGTHVDRTGDIGLVQVQAESGVAAGVRRIEAVTGTGALGRVRRREELLRELGRLLKASEEEAPSKLEKLLTEQKELLRRLDKAEQSQSRDLLGTLAAAARDIDGGKAVVAKVDGVGGKGLRPLTDQLRDKLGSVAVVLVGVDGGKVGLVAAVTEDLVGRHKAGYLVRELAPLVDGRGGGKPDFAQAGGKNLDGIPALLARANELLA